MLKNVCEQGSVPDSINSPRECAAPDQKPDEKDVRKGCREVDDLSRGLDGLPDAEVYDDPGQDEEAEELPRDSSKVLYAQ